VTGRRIQQAPVIGHELTELVAQLKRCRKVNRIKRTKVGRHEIGCRRKDSVVDAPEIYRSKNSLHPRVRVGPHTSSRNGPGYLNDTQR